MKKGVLYALGSGICWGLSLGIYGRSMAALGFSTVQIAAVRTTISALFFALLVLVTDRRAFRIRVRDIWIFVCTGAVSVTLFCIFYFTATQHCSIAVAEVLSYTYPMWVIVFSAVLFREKLTRDKLIALVTVLVGCVLVSGITSGIGDVSLFGVTMALLSGIMFATYPIFSRFAIPRYGTMTINFYTFLVASVTTMTIGNPVEVVTKVASPAAAPVAVIGGILCAALPYFLYTKAMDTLDNGMVSILATSELFVASLVSIVYYREPMSAAQVAGVLLVFAAIIWLAAKSRAAQE